MRKFHSIIIRVNSPSQRDSGNYMYLNLKKKHTTGQDKHLSNLNKKLANKMRKMFTLLQLVFLDQ